MTPASRSEALRLVGDLIEKQCGLAFPDRHLSVLASKLEPILEALGASNLQEAAEVLSRPDPAPLPEVMQALTVGETYFFRNRAQFEALRSTILPALTAELSASEPLVVWSAGCATGEEPYSLAMWIREYAPHLWPGRLRIVATDINREFLARARQGIYREWSLRQVEDFWRRRYFAVDGPFLKVDEALREVIQFREHNLVKGLPPAGIGAGGAHLVLCRNVLIYFLPSRSAQVLELFSRALATNGVLMLGHAESLATLKRWRATYHPGTFTYQPPKDTEPNATAAASLDAACPQRARTCGRPTPSSATLRNARASSAPPPVTRAGQAPPSTSTAGATHTAAQTASAAGRQEAATAAATKAATQEADLERARRAADTGELATARRLLDAYTAGHKTSTEAHFLAALVADQLSDWEGARAALKKALFLERNLVVGHYLLAVINEREGASSEALRGYRTVCRLLRNERSDAELPLGDGLTAGQLRELSEARSSELGSQGD